MEIATLLEEKILTISSMENYCSTDKTAPSQETVSLSIDTTGESNRLADYSVENYFSDIQWDKHHSFALFPDGSYYHTPPEGLEAQSAWAFTVMEHTTDLRIHLTGVLSGPTVTDFQHHLYQGVTEHSSANGEALAMVWALAWAIAVTVQAYKMGLQHQMRFYMHYDNSYIGDLTAGKSLPQTASAKLSV